MRSIEERYALGPVINAMSVWPSESRYSAASAAPSRSWVTTMREGSSIETDAMRE